MSEQTSAHYRTGTFPVTVTGMDGPTVVEGRWVREHHVVHLFLPELQGTAEGSLTLSALPAQIRPSRAEVFPVPVRLGSLAQLGVLAWDALAPTVQAHATLTREAFNGPFSLGPCAVHYLSIPGQVQDAAGVMQRVPAGEEPAYA